MQQFNRPSMIFTLNVLRLSGFREQKRFFRPGSNCPINRNVANRKNNKRIGTLVFNLQNTFYSFNSWYKQTACYTKFIVVKVSIAFRIFNVISSEIACISLSYCMKFSSYFSMCKTFCCSYFNHMNPSIILKKFLLFALQLHLMYMG